MESITPQLFTLLALAAVVRYLIEAIKALPIVQRWETGRDLGLLLLSLALGLAGAIYGQIDLIAVVFGEPAGLFGMILTGLAVGAGGSLLHDILSFTTTAKEAIKTRYLR